MYYLPQTPKINKGPPIGATLPSSKTALTWTKMRHISGSELLRGDDPNPYSQEPCDNETLDHLLSFVKIRRSMNFHMNRYKGFFI